MTKKTKRKLTNITFSVDPLLVSLARQRAKAESFSLNDAFQEWLEQFARPNLSTSNFRAVMAELKNVRPGRKFTRDEMNER